MQTVKHISIPEPCSQSWLEMSPTDGGRHCAHCCKTVTDFTVMSNQQIINHLSNNQNVCGRIDQMQLLSINSNQAYLKTDFFNWKAFAVAASLLLAVPATNAFSQHRITKKTKQHKIPVLKPEIFKNICGVITDSLDRSTLPGAVIIVTGSNIHTVADLDGRYSIRIPEHITKLEVKYSGYDTLQVKINTEDEFTNIAMVQNRKAGVIGYPMQVRREVLGGAISVITCKKAPFYKRWYNRFIKAPIKKVLG